MNKGKRIDIENENSVYIHINVNLNILLIKVKARNFDGKTLLERKFLIKNSGDIESNGNVDYVINIDKEVNWSIPIAIYSVYKEYLKLKSIEKILYDDYKEIKILEFGEVQDGEEDYLP